ncbi:putative urea ABC transporter substrate-binding protein [Zooshikella harenae]|uniref:Urea ABC transporter substrate-binding protein n=1 Tax=Zooshikella harenae TaxID=2827238 RepID=A0ABS5Z5Z9_9GAMM|nr:putative urea ABC transporter substrate-binding protein [Zooshikella harenae]MBU2709481.1 putative urea ABC transporter substrate-binding protein [Zooshikella harenae]
MIKFCKKAILFGAASLLSTLIQAADTFNVAWSHYTGWEPWAFAEEKGILKKWADKYDIEIKLTLVNDYIESINLYTGGKFDACSMTNMDALTIPAVGGIDSTAIIIGDYSNGNDGIVLKNGKSVKDLKDRKVTLVELSVSHYLLARALDMNGMSERDVKVVNTSDSDIASLFIANENAATVTWNPPLQQVRNSKGANLVFDSSKIPGEILDLMIVKTGADERLKKALTGAWYETMAIMSKRDKEGKEAIQFMASNSGATEAEFNAQLKTTRMFYTAKEASELANSGDVKKTMEHVRQFSFDKGLFGANASSPDFVGIEFSNGEVLGNKKNVKLRFIDKYMKMAADNKL